MFKRFFCNPKVIALLILSSVVAWVVIFNKTGTIPVNPNAVIITGECVVINYDASVKDWDEAKAAWLKARNDVPATGSGHTKAYY